MRGTHSLSRTSDAANAVVVGPKRSASASRGRLGRTLSASASANNGTRAPVPAVTPAVATAPGTPVVQSANNVGTGVVNVMHTSVSGTVGGSGSSGAGVVTNGFLGGNGAAGGGLVNSSSATTEGTGRRAFIRRMRSNESAKRIARSSSSTGVENKRSKGYTAASGPDSKQAHGHGQGNVHGDVNGRETGVVTAKSTPYNISDSVGSEDDVVERDIH